MVRQRDLIPGAGRVVRSHHADDEAVRNPRLRVRRALAIVEDAGLGGGVVAGLVAHAEAPSPEAMLAQDVCDRGAHLSGGQPRAAQGEGGRARRDEGGGGGGGGGGGQARESERG